MATGKKGGGAHRGTKNLVTKVALTALIGGGVLVALAVAPAAGAMLKLIDPNPRKAMDKLERAARRLVQSGDIEELPGKERCYRLKPAGERKLARLRFVHYVLPKAPKAWDKRWRVVCFDIPETQQYVRRVFQSKLSELGFYRLQQSVFVHPYPCAELISLADKAFELRPHLRVIVADSIDNEQHLLNFYKLKR